MQFISQGLYSENVYYCSRITETIPLIREKVSKENLWTLMMYRHASFHARFTYITFKFESKTLLFTCLRFLYVFPICSHFTIFFKKSYILHDQLHL